MPGSRFCVWALNALQNSMMLRPRCPRAGPIGGDGLALPAGTCNLIIPTIFLAMPYPSVTGAGEPSDLLDLGIFELDRGRPAEDRHGDLDPRLHLDDLLGRHEDLLEAFAQALLLGLLTDRRRHLLLEAGIDVDHIPAARHPRCSSPRSPARRSAAPRRTTSDRPRRRTPRR